MDQNLGMPVQNTAGLGAPMGGGLGAPLGGGLGAPMGGGLGAPMGASLANPTPFGANAGLGGVTQNSNDQEFAIIGYIAPTESVLKPAISTKSAKEKFAKLSEQALASNGGSLQKAALTAKNEEQLDKATGKPKMITLTSKFSMCALRTFFPDAYKELSNENKFQIDMSISRVEYFIIKNTAAEGSANQGANGSRLNEIGYYDPDSNIAAIKQKGILDLLTAISKWNIPVVIDGKTAGYLVIVAGKQNKEGKQNVNVIFVDKLYNKQANIRSLEVDKKRVPFVVHRKMTVPSTKSVPVEDILNYENFHNLFPDRDPSNFPTRKTIRKANFERDEDFRAAKQAEIYKYDEIKAACEAAGISATLYNSLNSAKPKKSGRGYDEIMSKANQALKILITNRK